MLKSLAEAGAFDECLATVKMIQAFDLEYLAKTDRDRRHVSESVTNISIGENHYLALQDYPDIYRNHVAAGFIPADRRGGLPVDGMQKALASYLKHLGSRNSMLLAAEEREMIQAQIFLVDRMTRRYTQMQAACLAG